MGKVETLARVLGSTCTELRHVAKGADQMYRVAKEYKKADGTLRQTFDAFPALKTLQ